MFVDPLRVVLLVACAILCVFTITTGGFAQDDPTPRIVPGSGLIRPISSTSLTIVPIYERSLRPDSPLGVDPCSLADAIGFNQTIRKALSPFDCHIGGSRTANFYIFDGIEGQQVIVDITSVEFDTYGGLTDGGDFMVEADGGGVGTNTRITATLPTTGEYLIIVTSSLPSRFGYYNVTLNKTPACTYLLTPPTIEVPALGASSVIGVTTEPGCYWEAFSSDRPHMRLLDDGSMRFDDGIIRHRGSGNFVFVMGLNETGSTFSGSIAVAGQLLQVTQPTLQCTYAISSTGVSIPGHPFTGQLEVITQQGCAWTQRNNDPWLGINSPAVYENRGPAMLTYSVSSNSTATQRTGTITIAGYTFMVTQAGLNCTYSLPQTQIEVPAESPTGTFRVNTQQSCTFGFNTGPMGYLVQMFVPFQSGSMDVTYLFQRNYEAHSRIIDVTFLGAAGTIRIPITFTQAAAVPQPFTISGRVLAPNGAGVRNATVKLIEEDGSVRRTITSSFGVYNFAVMTGYEYTLVASTKRYRFSPERYLVLATTGPIDLVGIQ